MTDTTTIYAPHAEQALIGALFIDHGQYPDIAQIVGPDDFEPSSRRGELFAALGKIPYDAEADGVMTIESLREIVGDKAYERVGRYDGVTAMCRACPDPCNAPYYAKLIAEAAWKRRFLTLIDDLRHKAEAVPASELDFTKSAELTENLTGAVAEHFTRSRS